MQGERKYSMGAAIADFYVLGIVFGAGAAFYVVGTGKPVPLWEPFLALAFSLTVVIAYHAFLARTTPLLTPGEVMMGRVLEDRAKRWTNPYGISRAALFTIFFVALVGAGNSWDSAADERFYSSLTLPVVLGRIAILSCLLVGLVLLGRGKPKGGVLVVAYFGLSAIAAAVSRPPAGVSESVTRSLAGIGLLMTVASAVVLLRYLRATTTRAER